MAKDVIKMAQVPEHVPTGHDSSRPCAWHWDERGGVVRTGGLRRPMNHAVRSESASSSQLFRPADSNTRASTGS